MPLTTEKINSEMYALVPISDRLEPFKKKKSESEISDLIHRYILNTAKKNAIKIYKHWNWFLIRVITIHYKNMETCMDTWKYKVI